MFAVNRAHWIGRNCGGPQRQMRRTGRGCVYPQTVPITIHQGRRLSLHGRGLGHNHT
ncbi:unnamed protein product, partial [Nesidiocoris tenuis]